jgi:hypothetical protein
MTVFLGICHHLSYPISEMKEKNKNADSVNLLPALLGLAGVKFFSVSE